MTETSPLSPSPSPATCGRCAVVGTSSEPPPRHAPGCPGIVREVRDYISQANGTLHWHKFNMLFYRHLASDGAKMIADQCGAYWLLESIASHYVRKVLAVEPFAVWTLDAIDGEGAVALVADDGNGRQLVRQEIPYSDFPRDLLPLRLYCENSGLLNGRARCIMLPEER
jgi:hypothetical protein